MTAVLFCWELGANLGHLGVIGPMRPALAAAGYDVSIAVIDLLAARDMLGAGVRLLQSPRWPDRPHGGARLGLASYADVLAAIGFHRADRLGLMVDSWLALFELTGAEIAVIDHGPAAQIAAALRGMPMVLLGSAFTLPPAIADEFPLLRADIPPAVPEATILRSVHETMAARGADTLPRTLPAALAGHARLPVGLPELDPYASFRQGSLYVPPGGFPGPLRGPLKRAVFAYLGPELPGLHEKVRALCALPCPVDIYIRGGDPFLVQFIRQRGKTGHQVPADMDEIFGRVTHVISHGGAMLAAASLSAGRPHLMLPVSGETSINAAFVARLGAGTSSSPTADGKQFTAELERFLDDVQMQDRAADLGKVLATRPLPDAGVALMQALGELRRVSATSAAAR